MDWYPLLNSLRIAAISTAVVYLLGIWLADVVARAPRVVKGILDVVLTLPLVLPPTVVGYLLLVLLGPRRPIGSWVLATFGVKLTMTWYSAIFATVVVSFPLMYRTARGAFEGFDQSLADAGRTLGKSNYWVFWRVKMPACRQGIIAGSVLGLRTGAGRVWRHLDGRGLYPGLYRYRLHDGLPALAYRRGWSCVPVGPREPGDKRRGASRHEHARGALALRTCEGGGPHDGT
jgi:molybdate transport system permease protein